MHIQGIKLKKGQVPQKGSLYQIKENYVISFKEKGSSENVDIQFELAGEQTGFYAEEYRPNTIAKEGANVIDITAFIIDEGAQKCNWYVFDVKKDVGGEDVIFHLCEQWQAGLKYLKNSVLVYLEDFKMEEHIGVITRQFDEARIAKAISLRESKIKKIDDFPSETIVGRKMRMERPKIEAEKNLLKHILNRKFFYKENGISKCYTFEVLILAEKTQNDYFYSMMIEMG